MYMHHGVLGFQINISLYYIITRKAPESMETINIMEIGISYLFIIIMTQ